MRRDHDAPLHWYSENHDQENEDLYPPRTCHLVEAVSGSGVPFVLAKAHKETIHAFNEQLFFLTSIGLRSLVESICKHKGISDGPVSESGSTKRVNNLRGKINGLREANIINETDEKALHLIRDIGNEAAHELSSLDVTALKTAIKIVEHVLLTVFEVPTMISEIKAAKFKKLL